jgi:hypothetical protein
MRWEYSSNRGKIAWIPVLQRRFIRNLMLDNLEELEKAAILARRLVQEENRLGTLERCNAPDKIIAMEKERFSEFKEEVGKNPFAKAFLPQARKALAIGDRRSTYFRTQTFLGKVAARIEEYCDAKWHPPCDETLSDPTLDPTDIVHTESDEEMLTHFLNAITTGDARKILLDLKVILSHARFDIEMRTDVPPPGPQLQVTAARKFMFSLESILKEEDD